MMSLSCKCQNYNLQDTSTCLLRDSLLLEGDIYTSNSYKVLYYQSVNDNYYERRLFISMRDSILYSLRLPIADEEVKNFGVNSITKSATGFILECGFGGGNYIYTIYFYFDYIMNSFYLTKYETKLYYTQSEEIEICTAAISPPDEFKDVDILQYIGCF